MDAAALKQTQYRKRLGTLRTLLHGARHFVALRALEFALRHHGDEFRKDGITPGFDHQVSIALYVLTLPDLYDREGQIVVALWHDTPEDYFVHKSEMIERFPRSEHERVAPLAHASELLNKYNPDRSPKDEDEMWKLIAHDPYASIVKPADRVHNFRTMNTPKPDGEPVFGYAKQVSYTDFAECRILPMMKIAREYFPEQRNAYENMKHMIESQIELVRAMASAVERASNVRRIEIARAN